MREMNTDILIIGGGAAGTGAAFAAAKASKYNIILIERDDRLGGTAVNSGVHAWEPGVASGEFSKLLANRLIKEKNCCIGRSTAYPTQGAPWGMSKEAGDDYSYTLRRSGLSREQWRRFHFYADKMSEEMENELLKYDYLHVLKNTKFIDAVIVNCRIINVIVKDNNNEYIKITAKIYIDSTSDIEVARMVGCKYRRGMEGAAEYNEPSAPKLESSGINGVSLMFDVTPVEHPKVEGIPEKYRCKDVRHWFDNNVVNEKLQCVLNFHPNGDININMLPTLDGCEYINRDEESAYELAKARLYHYWNWLQSKKSFSGYRIKKIYPRLGVRESYRLIGKYVLTENDIRLGRNRQPHNDELIALADHALDYHGCKDIKGKPCQEIKETYGIPFSCLVTNEIDNLLVACKGSSLTHIAASSARLTRTMIAIGEAAGKAAVMAIDENVCVSEINSEMLSDSINL